MTLYDNARRNRTSRVVNGENIVSGQPKSAHPKAGAAFSCSEMGLGLPKQDGVSHRLMFCRQIGFGGPPQGGFSVCRQSQQVRYLNTYSFWTAVGFLAEQSQLLRCISISAFNATARSRADGILF